LVKMVEGKSMSYSTIIYTTKDHVVSITLNRPEAANRVNLTLAQELAEACRRINQDDEVYVAVLSGAGKAFCGGWEEKGVVYGVASAVASIEKPVIAAINGDALGQGLEIALSCDIRLALDKAKFGFPEVAEGSIPADGGTQRLARLLGRGKALELILTAETITAKEALEIGLVDRVVGDKLTDEAKALAEGIASKGPIALKFIKEAVNKGLDMTLEQGLRLEGDLYFLLHTTTDRTEGITSFLKKRPPKFKNK
jgi:enoyl-CoA hydratase